METIFVENPGSVLVCRGFAKLAGIVCRELTSSPRMVGKDPLPLTV